MSDKICRMLATFFYIGEIPLAPGSAASLVGALMSVALHKLWPIYILVWLAVTAAGFMVSGYVEEMLKEKDPSRIVIDEVSGIMIAFFLLPLNVPVLITAFFLFRAFDMFKLYPVNTFEKLPGSVGIMLDDIIAGVYTNIAMHIAIRMAGVV